MGHTRLDPSSASVSVQLDIKQIIEVDFSSTNLPASNAYLELDSSLNQDIKAIQVSDTGGAVMALATGAALSEADVAYFGPGTNETHFETIASGTRISIRRVDGASAVSTGYLVLNLLG